VSLAQRFAQIFGGIYLLVGILGLIPPLLIGTVPGALGPFAGFLIGLFAVNWFHSLAHLAIGVGGLAAYRNPEAASIYALVVGIAYALLFILGLIFALSFLGGLLPLNGLDHVLHLLTAVVALGAYFASRGVPATSSHT
jgi:Domain of unknown function (DUF4383)